MKTILVNNHKYKVKEAKTLEEITNGLRNVSNLPKDEGMLFYLDNKELLEIIFTMKGMEIPLDIIFINLDQEVIQVEYKCRPGETNIVGKVTDEDDIIAYVLEVNPNSKIKVGDELEFEDDKSPIMKVLALDGTVQMELWGGERIFRRPFTKQLIKAIKKADSLRYDEEKFKALCRVIGRKIFKEINAQDNRKPDYVKAND